MRIALGVEYDGSQFHGWQRQNGLHTIQGSLEQALSKVADHEVQIACAGRTDTGVHATGQVIHFDSDADRNTRSWLYGANAFLPKDICVRWSKQVDEEFHARFSASARRYQYFILNNPIRPAIFRSGLTWQYRPLDHEKMHQAGQRLLGEKDFTSFRSVECQSKTPMRNVHHLNVIRRGDIVVIDIKANAFLHHMVRNVAGVLMAVGSGRKPVEWVEHVLQAKDRRQGAETAPAYGLYLLEVDYPEQFAIPKPITAPVFYANSSHLD